VLKLYELPGAFRALEDEIDRRDGELDENLEARLDELELTLEEKADAIAALVREAEAEAIGVKVEQDRLAARRQTAERRAARLKAYLHDTLVTLGRDKVQGQRFRLRVQRNGVPTIRWIRDLDELPESLKRITVTLDGTAAHDAYKAGQLPDGFDVSFGTHLRIS
jgi:chromosome segregation ATPase